MAPASTSAITPDEAFTEAYRSHRLLVHGDDPKDLPQPLSGSGSGGKKRKRREEEQGSQESQQLQHTSDDGDGGGGGFFIADDDEEAGGGGFFTADDNDEDDGGAEAGAGFFAAGSDADANEGGAGGFLPGDNEDNGNTQRQTGAPAYLPISEIPHALTLLNLPSTDRSILAVFENGAVEDPNASGALARGPDAGRRRSAGAGGSTSTVKVISRDDFKQVCEVLMDTPDGEAEDDDEAGASPPQRRRRRVTRGKQVLDDGIPSDDDDDDSDVYQESNNDEEDDEADEDVDDQYIQSSNRRRQGHGRGGMAGSAVSSKPTRRRRQRKTKTASDSLSDDSDSDSDSARPQRLTASQRNQITDLWSLFTDKLDEVDPSWRKGSSSGSGSTQPRLSARELHRLAIIIGEKVSDKDVEEMMTLANNSFAPVTANGKITREAARLSRTAAAKRDGKAEGVGIDEFAGVLVRGRMV